MVVTLTEVDTEFGECGHYTCKIIRLQDVKGRHDSKFLGVDDWALRSGAQSIKQCIKR